MFDDVDMGIDLIAINMQRGRDHGLPGYIKYRRICHPKEKLDSFEDLRSDMNPEVAQNIESIAVCRNGACHGLKIQKTIKFMIVLSANYCKICISNPKTDPLKINF